VRVGERPIRHRGLVARIAGRDLFVPLRKIATSSGRVHFVGERVDLRRFRAPAGELLLAQTAQPHLINLVGGRLIRANEIELQSRRNWEVVGVDPRPRPSSEDCCREARQEHPPRVDRRLGEHRALRGARAVARLRIPYRKLARLHPARSPTSSRLLP